MRDMCAVSEVDSPQKKMATIMGTARIAIAQEKTKKKLTLKY